MKKSLIFIYLLATLAGCSSKTTRIACIGDSITEGAGISLLNKYSYPAQLDSIMGSRYHVLNSGKGGTALQIESDYSYWNSKEFSNVFAFEPDIIIIGLGTNDTKPQNWDAARFEKDYQSLIDTLQTANKQVEIYICVPMPAFEIVWGINDSILNVGVIPIIKELAQRNKLKLIDLNTPFKNKQEYFPDHIHPNEAGAKKMAEVISDYIKNN